MCENYAARRVRAVSAPSATSMIFLASAKTISLTRNASVFVSNDSAAMSKLSVRICNDTYAPTKDARGKSSIERGALL